MSNPRLKIASAFIDGTEAGTSTIAGTIFSFGDRATGLEITETPTEIRIPFRIRVFADDNATMLDRVQDVLDLLDSTNEEGLIIEMEPGVEVVDIVRDTVKNLRYETTRKPGDNGMIIEGNFLIEKIDPDFSEGTGSWQYQRNGSGRGFVVGRLSAASRAAAVTLASPIRAGTIRPVWMGSSFRVQEDTNAFDFSGGAVDGSEGHWKPAEITIVFEQLPAWAAGNSAFNDVVKLELTFAANQREELDVRAGNMPGLDVDLSGRLTFKTEQGTTYDSTDSTIVAGSALPGKVAACIAAIIAEAENRLGEGPLLPMAGLDRSVTGEDGVYQFAIPLITEGPSRVMTWDEEEVYERTTQDVILDIFDGANWEMEHPGGFRETIQHTLTVVSLSSGRDCPAPQMMGRGKGRWKLMRDADKAPKIKRKGSSNPLSAPTMRFTCQYAREYLLLRSGGGGSGGPVITPGQGAGGGAGAQGYRGVKQNSKPVISPDGPNPLP